MEKLRKQCHIVFGITLCLLVHSHGHTPSPVFTLYCQNMSLRVKGGEVSLSTGRPTLYSLVSTEYYIDDNSTSEENFSITMEAIATGKFICMNRKGRVYTMDSNRSQTKLKKSDGGKFKKLPHKNCLFKKLTFSSRIIYRDARGIYSKHHSNEMEGLFLSFSKESHVRGVVRRFDSIHSKDDNWIKLEFDKTNVKVRSSYLNYTRFSKVDKFNSKVRKCIRREIPNLFGTQGTSHDKVRHRNRKILKHKIASCKKKVDKNLQNKNHTEETANNEIIVDGRKSNRKSISI